MPDSHPARRKRRSFRAKLALAAIGLGVLPLALVSVLGYLQSRAELRAAVTSTLTVVRDERHRALSTYFETFAQQVRVLSIAPSVREAIPAFTQAFERLPADLGWTGPAGEATEEGSRRRDDALRGLGQMYASEVGPRLREALGDDAANAGALMPSGLPGLAAQHLFLATSPHPLGSRQLLERPSGAPTSYGDVHARFHPYFAAIAREYGMDGFLLVDASSGSVVYTYGKKPDFGSNVREGALKDTGFAKVARQALAADMEGQAVFGDFELYVPALGTPTAFAAAPVRVGGRTVGALVVQLPQREASAVLAPSAADGASGETYFVGTDQLMRSDSRFEKTSSILRRRIDSEAVRQSLAGRAGTGIAADYRGVECLVAYRPLVLQGLTYGLVAKVDTEQAFAPLQAHLYWMVGFALVLGLAALGIGLWLATSLARPMAHVTERLQALAQGLLSTAQEQQAGAAESAAAVEETRQTFGGVLQAAQNLKTVGGEVLSSAEIAQRNAQTIGRRIRDLSTTTAHIGEILNLVKEIANRSDLLALNAALEGTKAGEAGRGFSLVATQMQRLAEEVMGSAKKIEGLTQEISRASGGAVLAAEEAEKVAASATTSAHHIAEGVQSQQAGAEQVSVAMNEIAQVAQGSVEAARKIVTSSNELLGVAEELRQTIHGSA